MLRNMSGGGANITLGEKWRLLLPYHVRRDILASFAGVDLGPYQYTIGSAELGMAVINELLYIDGQYDITQAGIDNAGSKAQLEKFKAKPLVCKHLLRVVAILRAIHKPVVNYSYIKSEHHLLYDMVSRSLDENGVSIAEVEEEILQWEHQHDTTLKWREVPQWIIDLVFPVAYNMEIPELLEPLKELLGKAADEATPRCFSKRCIDVDRPTPMPLSEAAYMSELMVEYPDSFPLPENACELTPFLKAKLRERLVEDEPEAPPPRQTKEVISPVAHEAELPAVPVRSLRGPKLTNTSLYAGGGGDALGWMATGGDLVCAVDHDAAALKRVEKMTGCKTYCFDFNDRSKWADLPVTDGLTAGIPCITYSMLGGKRGPDDPRHMHRTTIDFIEYRQKIGKGYKFLVLEIVLEMLDHEKGLPEQKEAVERLRGMGYQVGLKPESLTGHDVVSAYEHGLPLHKVRMFTRAAMQEEGFQLCPIVPSRSPEHPKCLADIMVPDCCVDDALFAPNDLKIIPQTPATYDPSMPHTVARVRSGVGWPGYPTRFCLHTGAYYTCMASGNIAYVVTPEGNARMLAILEVAAAHGFPLWYCHGATRRQLLKWFGNSICPPVARAVFDSIKCNAVPCEQGRSPLDLPVPSPEFPLKPGPESVAYTGTDHSPEAVTNEPVEIELRQRILDQPRVGRPLSGNERRGKRKLPDERMQARYIKVLEKKRGRMQREFGHDCWTEIDIAKYSAYRDMTFANRLKQCQEATKYDGVAAESSARSIKQALGVDGSTAAKLVPKSKEARPPLRSLTGRKRVFAFGENLMGAEMRALIEFEKRQLFSNRIASSTKKRYTSNYKFWVEFCKAVGASPLLYGRDAQADTKLLCDYVVYEHCIQKNGFGTVKNKLWAIRHHNMEFNLQNPLEDKPQLDNLLKAIKLKNAKVNRKMPVTPQMLRYILGAGDMTKLRTKAVVTSIIFAFAFLLRVSEYAAETANVIGPHIIRRHHVVFKRGGFVVNDPRQADEIEITIPSSKTDQAGQGYVRNHFKTDQDLCVVRLMADWFAATPNADKYDPAACVLIPKFRQQWIVVGLCN